MNSYHLVKFSQLGISESSNRVLVSTFESLRIGMSVPVLVSQSPASWRSGISDEL